MRLRIASFFNAITVASIGFFSSPALIIAKTPTSNEKLSSLKTWSLIMIALIDFFIIGARILLRGLKINLRILKKLSILLTTVLGMLMYGVSSMMTQIFLLKQTQIDSIFAYQTWMTIIVGLLLGTLLFYTQLSLKEENTDRVTIPITYVFLVIASIFMLCKSEFLELNKEAMVWVRISSALTILLSFSLLFVSFNRAMITNICEELYIIAYIPICIYWCSQGVLQIIQQVKAAKQDNVHFLILCSWVLFWGIAPAIIQSVVCLGEISWNLFNLLFNFARRRDGRRTQTERSVKKSAEIDAQGLKQISLEEAKEKACPICWEEFKCGDNIIARDSCCHCYHVNCLNQWILRDMRCPLCRGYIFHHEIGVSCNSTD